MWRVGILKCGSGAGEKRLSPYDVAQGRPFLSNRELGNPSTLCPLAPRLPSTLFLLRSSSFAGQVELRRASRKLVN